MKWRELLSKLRSYSTEKFYNEVLGLPADSGTQPVTYDQLAACCVSDRMNRIPRPGLPNTPPLVMGVDWAFTAEDSYTFVVVGGWNPFPHKFEVFYWKCFKGIESDSVLQIEWIRDVFRDFNIRLIGADWGAGHVQNLQLINALGEECVAQMWHTGMRGVGGGKAGRAKWEAKTRKYHLARTRVLTDTFQTIRQAGVTFPRIEDNEEFFDHLMAEVMEYNEKTNTQMYTNVEPDDGLHALTYAMLAGELYVSGDFRGHAGHQGVVAERARQHDLGEGAEDGWSVPDAMYQ